MYRVESRKTSGNFQDRGLSAPWRSGMRLVDFTLNLRCQRTLTAAFAFLDILFATFLLGFFLFFTHGGRFSFSWLGEAAGLETEHC